MNIRIAAALVTTAMVLAGCSGSAPTAKPKPSVSPTLSSAQGERICNDLTSWAAAAANDDQPRFDAQMTADENEAAGTSLGNELSQLDSDLQTENSVALDPAPPGSGSLTDLAPLQSDCAAYGVTFEGWNSTPAAPAS
jgi:hypothetical protein